MTQTSKPDPTDEAIDRLVDAHLAVSEVLSPSSGFAASVMESIHAQAAEPQPIAFPWSRVLPGLIAIACGMFALVVMVFRSTTSKTTATSWQVPTLSHTLSFAHPSSETTLGWIALVSCVSIAAAVTSLRLAGRNS